MPPPPTTLRVVVSTNGSQVGCLKIASNGVLACVDPPTVDVDILAFLVMKTYPYADISDLERRELYRKDRDTITDRDGMAEALNLSPNRVSELTIRGQLVAANRHPLRYAVKHNVECYANYKWVLDKKFFSRLTNLSPEGEDN